MDQQTSLADRPDILRRGAPSHRSFEAARRHSRRVRRLKIGLPVATAVLIALFSGWAWLSSGAGTGADISGAAVADGKLVMTDPKLNGFTRDNLPYTMSAERAVQDLSDTGRIDLETLVARVPIDAENWADIRAGSGTFDNHQNRLDIDSEMTITTTSGLVARLRSAAIDLGGGTVETAEPVAVEMKGSTLAADSMRVSDNGRVIVFSDQVRMTITSLASGDGDED